MKLNLNFKTANFQSTAEVMARIQRSNNGSDISTTISTFDHTKEENKKHIVPRKVIVEEDDELQGLSSIAVVTENRGTEVGIAIYTNFKHKITLA